MEKGTVLNSVANLVTYIDDCGGEFDDVLEKFLSALEFAPDFTAANLSKLGIDAEIVLSALLLYKTISDKQATASSGNLVISTRSSQNPTSLHCA